MIKDKIQALYDASSVQRCHALRTIQKDTVGSHSYRVACICMELADGMGSAVRMLELIRAALLHDAAEAHTGDICAPVKKILTGNLENIERDYLRSVGIHVPFLYEAEKAILKVADTLDLLMFSREEMKMGNTRMRPVFDKCEEWTLEMIKNPPFTFCPELKDKVEEIVYERK